MDSSWLEILVIEDDAVDYETIERLFAKAGALEGADKCRLYWASTFTEARAKLAEQSVDVILLDYCLPDSNGMESLKTLITEHPSIPVIIMTTLDDCDLALETLKHGAQDYLVKDSLSEHVVRTLRYAIERQQNRLRLIRAEYEARQAREAESRFLAHMSHEIRTPLTAILGFGEILLDEKNSGTTKKSATESIVRNGRHLLALVNDVLDFSKIANGCMEIEQVWFSPLAVLTEVIESFRPQAKQKNISIHSSIVYPIPELICSDPVRLKQILVNLVSNAIRFTNYGGVTVNLRADSRRGILEWNVTDTGYGIPTERLARIFNPFMQGDASTTRCFGGSGLGLTIARELTVRMGGKIRVSSTIGKGSVFSFSIRTGDLTGVASIYGAYSEFDPFESSDTISPEATEAPQLRGSVLIADDCDSNQELLSFLVRSCGLKVTVAQNGKEALAHVENSDFDLILMDIQMPELDGVSAVRMLREQGIGTSVIALTANANPVQIAEYLSVGFSDYLGKPFTQRKFYVLLEKYLDGNDEVEVERYPDPVAMESALEDVSLRFIEFLPERFKLLNNAFVQGDLLQVEKIAHKMAGAEMFGLPELGVAARALEHAAAGADATLCNELLSTVRSIVNESSKKLSAK